MLLFLLFAGAMLLAPIAGIWPPLRCGRAYNTAWAIYMPDPAVTYGQRWLSVLAQEVVEWWAAWLVALLLAALPALLLERLVPMAGAAGIPITILAWGWHTTDWGTRQLEYLGWGATWVQAQRTGVDQGTFADFAARMHGGYVEFQHMTVAQAEARLRRRLGIARVLVFLLSRGIGRAAP